MKSIDFNTYSSICDIYGLSVDEKLIKKAKSDVNAFSNNNYSYCLNYRFMQGLIRNKNYVLITGTYNSPELFEILPLGPHLNKDGEPIYPKNTYIYKFFQYILNMPEKTIHYAVSIKINTDISYAISIARNDREAADLHLSKFIFLSDIQEDQRHHLGLLLGYLSDLNLIEDVPRKHIKYSYDSIVDLFYDVVKELCSSPNNIGDGIYNIRNADQVSASRYTKSVRAQHVVEIFELFSKMINAKTGETPLFTIMPSSLIPETMRNKENRYSRTFQHMHVIHAVFEYDNTRMALLKRASLIRGIGMSEVMDLVVVPSDCNYYNYIDVGRYLISYHHQLGNTYKSILGHYIFSDIPANIPPEHVLEKYYSIGMYTRTVAVPNFADCFISNQAADSLVRKYKFEKQTAEQEEERKKILDQKKKAKVVELKSLTKDVKLNDVLYTKDFIEYQGQKLIFNSQPNTYSRIFETLSFGHDIMEINFDAVFDQFLAIVMEAIVGSPITKVITGTIGEVTFTATKRHVVSQRQTGPTTSVHYLINDYRINYEELVDCLRRALCFNTQEDYDAFLSSVSQCSLKIHNAIYNGINLILTDDLTGNEIIIKLILDRIKNLNYILIGEEKRRIQDIQKLMNLSTKHTVFDMVQYLTTYKVIADLTSADLRKIIEDGKILYEKFEADQKKLVEDVVKEFNLSLHEEETLKNGTTINNFYIIGGALKKYAITVRDNKVYAYPDGKYICIVDKTAGHGEKASTEGLINRIYALHNDSIVAKDIHTLA